MHNESTIMRAAAKLAELGIAVAIGLTASCVTSEEPTETDTTSALAAATDPLNWVQCERETHGDQIQISGPTLDFATQAPLAGVTVCAEPLVLGSSTCTTSGANGTYSLTVRSCSVQRVTYSMSGYEPANQILEVGATDPVIGTRMINVPLANELAGVLGVALDPTKAQPAITIWDAADHPLAGVAVKVVPASGSRWYLEPNGLPSGTATATTAAGLAGFVNGAVGYYMVQAVPPAGMTCIPRSFVPGLLPDSAIIQGEAGSIAEAIFNCE